MIELIFIIILIISFLGLSFILFKKMPVLKSLPEPSGNFKKLLTVKVKEKARAFPVVKNFSYELYLQRLLSRIRVLTLKTDHKTSGWLERLRQKNNKNSSQNDDYWDELKKAKEGK